MAEGAESYSVKRGGRWPALCAHPAFSALAAVSFAALLSGGSLLLPADLMGRLLKGSGSAVAAAPLGFTARATMAIASALAGMALGLSLARRVGLSLSAENGDLPSANSAPRCRPIDIAEDVGEEGIAPLEFPVPGLPDAPIDAQPTVAEQALTVAQPALTAASEEAGQRPPEPSLGDLGLMQLTARLAALLAERRKQRAATKGARPPAEPPCPAGFGGFDPSGAEDAARAIADFFAQAPSQKVDPEQAPPFAASDGRNGKA